MNDIKSGIQYMFQTRNAMTFAVSGTGHTAMECAIFNAVEAGESVLTAVNGIWGERAADMAERIGKTCFFFTTNVIKRLFLLNHRTTSSQGRNRTPRVLCFSFLIWQSLSVAKIFFLINFCDSTIKITFVFLWFLLSIKLYHFILPINNAKVICNFFLQPLNEFKINSL